MNPKMTAKDAANFLNIAPKQLCKQLLECQLPYYKSKGNVYFNYVTAKEVFKLNIKAKALAFQIVKGGTGKTSLACAVAIRANLYGLRVLCIDLDQQGNMTHSFGVDAELLPVMIDILAEDYKFEEAITRVYPGLDLLTSRIENALIDDVIKLKKIPLNLVYRDPIERLKKQYDLIVIDCPPNLGQSVAAITLAVDKVISPVVPENFALSGVKITANTIAELQHDYNQVIPFGIAINKFDARTILSQNALQMLSSHPVYQDNLLNTCISHSQEFPNAISKGVTIYDSVKPSVAKQDIDNLTRELLSIGYQKITRPKLRTSLISRMEETLIS